MNRKGGPRRKSRQKMRKPAGEGGKISIRKYLQSFKEGDNVQLVAESSNQKGLFPLRFYGKRGTVKAKRGLSYEVEITDQTKKKIFLVHPTHLKRL